MGKCGFIVDVTWDVALRKALGLEYIYVHLMNVAAQMGLGGASSCKIRVVVNARPAESFYG